MLSVRVLAGLIFRFPPSAPRLGNHDSVPLIEKRRGLSPGGRFPPIVSFIK